VEAAVAAGLEVDDFAPRLSFFWNAHNGLFQEAAKYRAARRMWAHLMRDRMGATSPASMRMRFHTQTAGSSLTAQQPLNNVVRTAYQALSAVLGGTQSLHTNSFDEALGLPTDDSARLALRTQQVLASETGIVDEIDPLAGSYHVEALTDEIEAEATKLIAEIDQRGGAVAAIADGFQQAAIEQSAYETALAIDAGTELVVGVNAYEMDEGEAVPLLRVDPELELMQRRRLEAHRRRRDSAAVVTALDAVVATARGSENLLYPMKDALRLGATVGEVSSALEQVFGRYDAS
jgi:methylmalonyl-CoA mutase N-terminal domain/subunit